MTMMMTMMMMMVAKAKTSSRGDEADPAFDNASKAVDLAGFADAAQLRSDSYERLVPEAMRLHSRRPLHVAVRALQPGHRACRHLLLLLQPAAALLALKQSARTSQSETKLVAIGWPACKDVQTAAAAAQIEQTTSSHGN